MRDVVADDFAWITKLNPSEAAKEYFRMFYLGTHSAYQKGWDAGYESASKKVETELPDTDLAEQIQEALYEGDLDLAGYLIGDRDMNEFI
jgi:hypothetical protein